MGSSCNENELIRMSIILPSLNSGKYIEECLSSVIQQTLTEIEIICVDAGSIDGTLDTIREYEKNDPRVHLIISKEKSYGYQMNLGINNAKGKYIGIVETDDFVPDCMFENLYNIAERECVDIVKADFYRFITKGNIMECTYTALDPSRVYYNRVIDPKSEPEVFRFVMNTWSGIYNRSFLLKSNIKHNEAPGASYQDTRRYTNRKNEQHCYEMVANVE